MRTSARAFAAALACALPLVACGSSDSAGSGAAKSTAIAVFAPPDSGALQFLDAPFPSDLYMGDDGTVDIGGAPDASDGLTLAFDFLNQRHGFCRACSIAFPIAGDLDPASVPKDAGPDATASLDDAIVLMRADGSGDPIPLVVDYDTVEPSIVVRPRYGIMLEPSTQYVAALTDKIKATDGTPLGPDAAFRAARDGGGGAAAKRTRDVVAPALAMLDKAGLAKRHVVAAAVFTTDDGAFMLEQIKSVVAAAPKPVLSVERVYRASDGTLDALLGMPTEDRPGVDNPPADGVGTAAIVHDAIDFVLLGSFESPRIVSGSGTDIGTLNQSADGAITPGPTPEKVPFVLVVPKNANLAKLPVVFAHPGLPSTNTLGVQVGNTFARLGMATLSIDAFQMGRRASSAKDEQNEFRGIPGADGFYEHSDTSVDLRVIGVAGAPAGHAGDVAYGVGFLGQVVSDAATSVRLLHEGDTSAVAAADPALAGFAFDPDQIYYLGQSFGSETGMMSLPIMEHVQAAILSVGPPDLVENLCNGPVNRASFEFEAVNILGLSRPFEEAGRRLAMNPRINLITWAGEPLSADSGLYYLMDHRLDNAPPPDILWFFVEHDEYLGQTSGEQVMGVTGAPVHGPTYLAHVQPLAAPLTANRQTPNGAITAGVWIHDADHSLIRLKHTQIDYETPFYPPFKKLATPADHVNPIEDAHKQMSVFFQTRMQAGRATLVDPAAP